MPYDVLPLSLEEHQENPLWPLWNIRQIMINIALSIYNQLNFFLFSKNYGQKAGLTFVPRKVQSTQIDSAAK